MSADRAPEFPEEPASGVRLVAEERFEPCAVLCAGGESIARLPMERACALMNSTSGAVCVVRERDGVLLATRYFIPAPTIAAWLFKLGWMHRS